MTYMSNYMLKRYYRRREEAITYLGGSCVICGSKDSLEIDHIEKIYKEYDIGKLLASANEELLYREIDKCQLLCSTHHKEKSSVDNGVSHGGGLSGKRNCKCILCKDRKRQYMQDYWKRRKQ